MKSAPIDTTQQATQKTLWTTHLCVYFPPTRLAITLCCVALDHHDCMCVLALLAINSKLMSFILFGLIRRTSLYWDCFSSLCLYSIFARKIFCVFSRIGIDYNAHVLRNMRAWYSSINWTPCLCEFLINSNDDRI